MLSPYILNNKRKRSSSFNSILSNLSKGSNVIYNNNKLLKNEDEGKKNEEKEEKKKEEKNEERNEDKNEDKNVDKNEDKNSVKNSSFERKDSISSWNDSKNVFDLDISQDENKSYLNGWNKDLLNNSQSSFNDIYNNNINKDSDMFSDINN